MERKILVIAGLCVAAMLIYVSLKPVGGSRTSSLDHLSAVDARDPWFTENVLKNPKTVLVDFTATWCGYCRQLEPILKKVGDKYSEQLDVIQVDVDDHQKVATAYEVSGIPLMMVFRNGKVVGVAAGMMAQDEVEKLVAPHIRPERVDDAAPETSEDSQESGNSSIVTHVVELQ
ncbi:thioredoxin family protein [Planctomicrobium sp. SH668]|uniref:thioredoxin family protein n=1 Tax=Planctomicrobium sp. SH668 TaxID=3448126 RepID=UPI003F5C50BB